MKQVIETSRQYLILAGIVTIAFAGAFAVAYVSAVLVGA